MVEKWHISQLYFSLSFVSTFDLAPLSFECRDQTETHSQPQRSWTGKHSGNYFVRRSSGRGLLWHGHLYKVKGRTQKSLSILSLSWRKSVFTVSLRHVTPQRARRPRVSWASLKLQADISQEIIEIRMWTKNVKAYTFLVFSVSL